ncbi:MAG: glycosyltransferase family 2 protein [Acidobacteria bacterium]|nr:glycosyltransferase family 2 protein [Acidobacteriota bacterium]
MPSPQATVIVPTLDGGEKLERCLAGLEAQTFTDFEIVVVDNSGRGSAAGAARDPRVEFVANDANVGFAAAINQGIERARGEFLCTLNDDARPDPRWLEELVAACRAEDGIGMCASQIRLAQSPSRLDSAGMQIYLDGSSKQRGRGEPAAAFDRPEEVLLPSACAALYRRSMLNHVGGFDADFFLYCEDTDLGLRARRAGWKCLYVPSATVYHHYSESAGRASPAKAFFVERNRLYTVVKNFPLWVLPLIPFFSLYRYSMHLWSLATGRGLASEFSRRGEKWWKLVIIMLSANFQALAKLPLLTAKRRRIRRTAVLSGRAFWRLLRRHSISARDLALQQ